MANYDGNIPPNCDKILFAEDIVNYIIFQILNTDYKPSIATPYREFIYEGFNDTVKVAVYDIYSRVKSYRTLFPYENEILDLKHFENFAKQLRRKYFKDGFDPRLFLFYCVHLAVGASMLAKNIGTQEAGDLAVQCILAGFERYDMYTGGWDTLNIVASKYASIIGCVDGSTPDSEITQSLEDDRSQISSLEEEDSDDDTSGEKLDKNHATVDDGLNLNELNVSLNEYRMQKLRSFNFTDGTNKENSQVTNTTENKIEVSGRKETESKSRLDAELKSQNVQVASTSAKWKSDKSMDAFEKQDGIDPILEDGAYSNEVKESSSLNLSDLSSTVSSDDDDRVTSMNEVPAQYLSASDSDRNKKPLKEGISPESDHDASVLSELRQPADSNSNGFKSSGLVEFSDLYSTLPADGSKVSYQNEVPTNDLRAFESENNRMLLKNKSPMSDYCGAVVPTTSGQAADSNLSELKSIDSVKSCSMCLTSTDENKTMYQNEVCIKGFLEPEPENNAISIKEYRSPKPDRYGSTSSRSEQTEDFLSPPSLGGGTEKKSSPLMMKSTWSKIKTFFRFQKKT